MVRESITRILNEDPEVFVVAQAIDGETLWTALSDQSADVLVMDYAMPMHDAPEAIRKIRAIQPELKILVLTIHENVHYAERAFKEGASGFATKATAADEILDAIKRVHSGQKYLSPAMTDKVQKELWNSRC